MEGYLKLRLNPLLRRLITRLLAIIPAVIVILIYGEKKIDSLLIFNQVLLSMQLGFAVIPLIHFVSDKRTMGEFAIKPAVKIAAWVIAAILVYLNVQLLFNEAVEFFSTSDSMMWKAIIIAGAAFLAFLLIYTILFPIIKNRKIAHLKNSLLRSNV